MMRKSATVGSIVLLLGLSACGFEGSPFTFNCSTFNGSRDGFRISIDESGVTAHLGDSVEPNVTTTWLNSDLRRVAVNCNPNWQISDATVVTEESNGVFKVVGGGLTRVTASVSGSGGSKDDSFEILALPGASEHEPNNGVAAANQLAAGEAQIGYMDYSDDVDYYQVEVPAGASFQIEALPAIDLSASSYFSSYSINSRLESADGSIWGATNTAHNNASTEPLKLYLRVSANRLDRPYRVVYHSIGTPLAMGDQGPLLQDEAGH